MDGWGWRRSISSSQPLLWRKDWSHRRRKEGGVRAFQSHLVCREHAEDSGEVSIQKRRTTREGRKKEEEMAGDILRRAIHHVLRTRSDTSGSASEVGKREAREDRAIVASRRRRGENAASACTATKDSAHRRVMRKIPDIQRGHLALRNLRRMMTMK